MGMGCIGGSEDLKFILDENYEGINGKVQR